MEHSTAADASASTSPADSAHIPLPNERSIRLLRFDLLRLRSEKWISEKQRLEKQCSGKQRSEDDVWLRNLTVDEYEIVKPGEKLDSWDDIIISPIQYTVNLDDNPPFIALSYCWGDPMKAEEEAETALETPSAVLYSVGGAMFEIPKNALMAIKAFAYQNIPIHSIWIDSLCINQSNTQEKASQVRLMGEIYSKALMVCVWMGPDISGMENFMWMNSTVREALMEYVEKHGIRKLQQQHPYDLELLFELKVVPPNGSTWSECWTEYFSFFRRRRWFSRAWVVQEVALAKLIVVKCGTADLAWSDILAFSYLIDILGWDYAAAPNNPSLWGQGAKELIRICHVRMGATIAGPRFGSELDSMWGWSDALDQYADLDGRASFLGGVLGQKLDYTLERFSNEPTTFVRTSYGDSQSSTNPLNLLGKPGERKPMFWFKFFQHLLWKTRSQGCRDPRDKIFAYLGIMQRIHDGPNMPIEPDYSDTCTTVELYKRVGCLLLMKVPRLKTLSYVEDRSSRNVQGLPSWIPDYSCEVTPEPLITMRSAGHSFDCWPQYKHTTEVTTAGPLLIVKGIYVDQIVDISISTKDAVNIHHIIPLVQVARKAQVPYLNMGQNLSEVLWRTLIADTHQREPAQGEVRDCFKQFLSWQYFQALHIITPDFINDVSAHVNSKPYQELIQPLQDTPATDNGATPSAEELLEYGRTSLMASSSKVKVSGPNHDLDYCNSIASAYNCRAVLNAGVRRLHDRYHKALCDAMRHRRLFRTEMGYLGLAPESTKIGDEVWMLQGATVPFILRRDKFPGWSLVGEAYLHGFMNGEMVDKLTSPMVTLAIA